MSASSGKVSRADVAVLIAAGGRGVRLGLDQPKQFLPVAGVPMLLRAIRPFARHPRVAQIVVALPDAHASAPPPWLADVIGDRLTVTAGGETRADSVLAALNALAVPVEVVLVHDAARPFVTLDTIDAVIEAVRSDTAVVPGVPVTDTLKRVEGDALRVVETVDRSTLWRAHTPQGFPREMLAGAFAAATPDQRARYTDEASLVEALGYGVRMVPDRAGNLKVTTEDDLTLAEFLATR